MSNFQTVIETDKLFSDYSPEAGDRKCSCSRCGLRIFTGSVVLRVWPESGGEYRYHAHCQGIKDPGPADWSFLGYQCQKCGNLQQEQGDCLKCQHWNMEECHDMDYPT